MNLETTGNVNADTCHVPDNDAVKNTPDKTKGSKRMKGSVSGIHEPEADQQAGIQPAEKSRKVAASKKVAKVKLNKEKEKVGEGVEKGETDEENVIHGALKLKTSPRKIIELFQSLNEVQLNEVVDMGFGALQHFGITEVPGKLAYDLVKRFNDVDWTLQLENQLLSIYPEDVYVTLGLPIGGTLINRINRQKKKPFVDEVGRRVGKHVERILPDDLMKEALKYKTGGEWFRKVFLLIVDTVLINPCGDGKCRTHIDHLFRDISVVKEYNWCAYVLETLSVAVKSWRSSKNTPFTGPISFLVAFYVDRVFHQKMLVSRVFPTVFGWTSEKLRLREKMELQSSHNFGRGSLVERGDPDKLPRPSTIIVFKETETTEKDKLEVAIEGFATASEDAARGLQNLMLSMTDLKCMIQNFESMKIAGSTACNMIGVITETTVDEKETVTSLEAALAKEKFNSHELVEAVKNMIKVTTRLTKLADEGPPFDIHPSFQQKNGGIARRRGVKQVDITNVNVIQNCDVTPHNGVNKSDTQERNNMIGTSFNGSSVASKQKGKEQEVTINVEEIVKSAMADYMDGGGDDAADEFCSEASATKTTPRLDNQLRINDETNGEELDVEAIVKSAVEAYMECDEDDADFVTPFTNKSEPKVGEALPNDRQQTFNMNIRTKTDMRCSNALRSPFLERAVSVSRKLTPDERVMYYWLMTTHHGNEEQIIYNDRVVEVMLLEFCSLLPHHEVSSGVISSFCSVLNHMEALKSVTSPKRLFFTTYPALYTVVMSNGRDDDADKLDEFASNIDKEVSEIPHFAWGDIDMVLHCVLCFKRKSVVIIDACKDGEDNDMRFTYGSIPEALVRIQLQLTLLQHNY
ncbi:hypothetical protein SASPL_105182 [Salvia splendens]|uniref:Aminotransferase-like plant mobile domain-containing protein n=1 Tax=Salvia splendens TaxID=180675 RepID=A0A8X8YIT9_SALSN|nr:hypothetical protein SASPL_105182 [Salvia splendens]